MDFYGSPRLEIPAVDVYLHSESQLRLQSREKLVFRMMYAWSISGPGRAAHIKIVQTDMDMDIGVCIYIRASGPRDISQLTSHSSI